MAKTKSALGVVSVVLGALSGISAFFRMLAAISIGIQFGVVLWYTLLLVALLLLNGLIAWLEIRYGLLLRREARTQCLPPSEESEHIVQKRQRVGKWLAGLRIGAAVLGTMSLFGLFGFALKTAVFAVFRYTMYWFRNLPWWISSWLWTLATSAILWLGNTLLVGIWHLCSGRLFGRRDSKL